MAQRIRILHLAGSATSEFLAGLSRLYAVDCLETVAGLEGFEHVIAHVEPGGAWRLPTSLEPDALHAADPLALGEAVERIGELAPDAAVPQMFCHPGMTHYRALLELLGLPYPGNTPAAMALSADKARARAVVAAAGVAVPEGEVLGRGERPALAPPFVVKPLDADNSLGVTLVRGPGEIDAALAAALEHSERALVERYVELGREVRCGIVEREDELDVLPLEEYLLEEAAHPVRAAVDKVASDGDAPRLVAKDNPDVVIVRPGDPAFETVADAARRCHIALGCRDHSLVDLRIDPQGRPWFLEAGLYCSFARQSVIATMARAAGTETPELFRLAIERCLERAGRPQTRERPGGQ